MDLVPFEVIGEKLGISPQQARVDCERALEKLRGTFRQYPLFAEEMHLHLEQDAREEIYVPSERDETDPIPWEQMDLDFDEQTSRQIEEEKC